MLILASFISESQVEKSDDEVNEMTCNKIQGDPVWVEGLVPGIDFCNHGRLLNENKTYTFQST